MKYKIVNPLRFTVALIVLVLCAILSIAFTQADREYSTQTIYIEPGDTLWAIAQEHNNTDMEIREYISLVCKLNEISPNIQPGQAIKIPID